MYCGYVVKLKDGRLHSNANRLKIFEIFGNNVITDLSYNDGDIVVYFPSDGQLSTEICEKAGLTKKYKPISELAEDEIRGKQVVNIDGIDCVNVGGYMDPDKRNVKAIKIRGEMSDGIVLPISIFSEYADTKSLKVGDEISVLNGHEICRKYIPKKQRPQQNDLIGKTKGKVNRKELKEQIRYPYFAEHKDTAWLAYNESAFHEGDLIYITRKVHGTSARTACVVEETKHYNWLQKLLKRRPKITKRYQVISGTKRTTLRDYNGGYYGSNQFRHPYHEFFLNKLPKGMEVYYEIAGWVDKVTPIMGSVSNSKIQDKEFSKMYGETTIFDYGCDPGESRIFVYRITMTNEDGVVVELPTEQCVMWCEKWGCEFVPILEKFFYTTWEDLNQRVEKWLDIPEPLANGRHIVEGVVVRIDSKPFFAAYKAKGYLFKVLEGMIKEEADAPDIEEAEELINDDSSEVA